MSGILQYSKKAWAVFASQPLVFIYCLTGAVLGACMIYLDEFWQLVLDSVGFPLMFFGAVGALAAVLTLPGNLLAYKIKARFEYRHILTCIICICIVGYAAICLIGNVFSLIAMMLLFLVMGTVDPLIMGYLHHHTESHIRATVESFSSLGLRVISVGVGLLFGYVSTYFSIFAGFMSLSAVCLLYFGFYLAFARRESRGRGL